jgi:hypothetical protein
MTNYKKHSEFNKGTRCSVEACDNEAEFEVVLYDYYSLINETYYEQDFTCPFLCSTHLYINEKDAKGERKPRGYVAYPYTNQHHAQGYSKYNPISEVYPELFKSVGVEDNKQMQVDLNTINDELIAYLAKHPEYLRKLDPRKFEELIADILHNQGYDVTLTPKSKDGGKDIVAIHKDIFGHQMFIVECKRYNENNKVGVELVRGLYGVHQAGNYNQSILATTSTFTKGAIDFAKPLNFQLSLKDYNSVIEWCKAYKI